ncbi:MFS transporter [Streptomyces xanthochromogenes]|uniref:MFS transporter n=1 Tax=Streptomyces xanthochromogenes TaxID=67384 RepID=UPI00342E5827
MLNRQHPRPGADVVTSTGGAPSLWRNRDFLTLWSGQVVSTLGARISSTAMPLLVLATTGSPADAGLVGAAGTLPFLIAYLPAGPLVDRYNRHRILLTSEILAGLALSTVPIALWLGLLTVAQLIVVAFVQGLCFVFFSVAETAALPRIVPPVLLPAAVAQNEARSRGAALAGGPLGGLLFGIDRALPFLADAISYAAASIALLFLRKDLQGRPTAPAEPLWQATLTGLRWIWRHPLIRTAVLLITVTNMVFQALVLTVVVLAQRHGAGPSAIGTMLGIYSGGGLAGALVAVKGHRYFTPKMVIIGVNWVWAALLPLFLFTTNPLGIGLIGAATSFISPVWNVVIFSYTALLVPNDILGRVTSAAMTLAWGVMPIGSLAAGLLLTAAGPRGAVLALTAVMVATAVGATISPAVRHAPPLSPPDAVDDTSPAP